MDHPIQLPAEFFADEAPPHFADCSNSGGDLPCSECDTMADEIREDFKAARYELERGN